MMVRSIGAAFVFHRESKNNGLTDNLLILSFVEGLAACVIHFIVIGGAIQI
jgi:hypothetical protein